MKMETENRPSFKDVWIFVLENKTNQRQKQDKAKIYAASSTSVNSVNNLKLRWSRPEITCKEKLCSFEREALQL